jgi:GT2 family glycosyltransferase
MTTSRWSAVIVNYNGAGYLGPCIEALIRTTQRPAEVVVVDNASTDDSLVRLRAYPHITLLARSTNLGFAAGANAGLAAVTTEFALLLNPDVEVDERFGDLLIDAFDRHPMVGAAGALLTFPETGLIQHAGGIVARPSLWTEHRGYQQPVGPQWLEEADVEYAIGAALGLRLAALREVGGFDERFTPAYFEDVDLCFVLRAAGWGVRYFPTLRALHHESAVLRATAARYRYHYTNRLRFAIKHLSPDTWRQEFIPSEIDTLRAHISRAGGPWWPDVSMATSIEAVLRSPDLPVATGPAIPIDAAPLNDLRAAVDALSAAPALPEVPPLSVGSREDGAARAEDLARLHRTLEDLREQQQTVNAAIVAGLAAQDRQNREQLALVLVLALDMLQYLQTSRLPAGRPADAAAETQQRDAREPR